MLPGLESLVRTARPPFLPLTPVCVFLGASVVVLDGGVIDWPALVLALAGALLAHAAVNMLNEYHDFRSGLDFEANRTPFSGGSGALPLNPGMATPVLAAGVACLLGSALIGLFFIRVHGWGIAPLGLLGLAIAATYMPWLNQHPVLCLVAPGRFCHSSRAPVRGRIAAFRAGAAREIQ